MAGVPSVGSSRYSSTSASSRATFSEVFTDQAPLGSRRSGWPGKVAARARTAAISSSGGKTPPLSLNEVKPYRSVKRRACSTTPAGSRAAPQSSFSAGTPSGCSAHL